jgi:putative transcriptional regulator
MPLFKTRMRVLRAERELTHAQLAAQVGVTRQTINSIEKARFHTSLRRAFRITRVFGKRLGNAEPSYRGKSGAKLVARFRETMATH